VSFDKLAGKPGKGSSQPRVDQRRRFLDEHAPRVLDLVNDPDQRQRSRPMLAE